MGMNFKALLAVVLVATGLLMLVGIVNSWMMTLTGGMPVLVIVAAILMIFVGGYFGKRIR